MPNFKFGHTAFLIAYSVVIQSGEMYVANDQLYEVINEAAIRHIDQVILRLSLTFILKKNYRLVKFKKTGTKSRDI